MKTLMTLAIFVRHMGHSPERCRMLAAHSAHTHRCWHGRKTAAFGLAMQTTHERSTGSAASASARGGGGADEDDAAAAAAAAGAAAAA